jgi:hypothetical protein
MLIDPASGDGTVRHPQVRVSVAPGVRITVDEKLAPFMIRLASVLPPHGRTDFSCQGDPGQRRVSAYVVISTPFEWWVNGVTARMAASISKSVGYPIRIKKRGHWPEYTGQSRSRTHIFIECDSIGGDQYSAAFPWDALYKDRVHRLTVRWRPEDFHHVENPVISILSEMKLHQLSTDRPA